MNSLIKYHCGQAFQNDICEVSRFLSSKTVHWNYQSISNEQENGKQFQIFVKDDICRFRFLIFDFWFDMQNEDNSKEEDNEFREDGKDGKDEKDGNQWEEWEEWDSSNKFWIHKRQQIQIKTLNDLIFHRMLLSELDQKS
jgi:hypothetical protein